MGTGELNSRHNPVIDKEPDPGRSGNTPSHLGFNNICRLLVTFTLVEDEMANISSYHKKFSCSISTFCSFNLIPPSFGNKINGRKHSTSIPSTCSSGTHLPTNLILTIKLTVTCHGSSYAAFSFCPSQGTPKRPLCFI